MKNIGKYFILLYFFLNLFTVELHAQELVYAKAFGGTGDDGAYDLVVDDSGNVYIIGWVSGTSDLNPGAGVQLYTSFGNRDISLCKFDSSGNFIWGFGMGSSGKDEGSVITLDSLGNIIIAGRFSNTIDFDPSVNVYTLSNFSISRDIYFAKYTPSGAFVWAKQIGGVLYDDAEDIITDSYNNIYLCGSFQSTCDFDPGPGTEFRTAQTDDAYIAKYTQDGNLIWVRTFGGVGSEDAASIKLDGLGDIYCAGLFEDVCTFELLPIWNFKTSAGSSDAFYLKMDTTGTIVWVDKIGASGVDAAYGLDYKDNELYITGSFSSIVDFDNSANSFPLTSNGLADIYFLKVNATGGFLHANRAGGMGFDFGMDIRVNNNNEIFATGMFESTSSFGIGAGVKTITSMGIRDNFVVEFDTSLVLKSVFSIGSVGQDNSHTLYFSKDNDLFISGFTGGVADFDPDTFNVFSLPFGGITDAFFAKYRTACFNIDTNLNVIGNLNLCSRQLLTYTLSSAIPISNYLTWTWPVDWNVQYVNKDTLIIVAGDSSGSIAYTYKDNCGNTYHREIHVLSQPSFFNSVTAAVCQGSIFIFPNGDTSSVSVIQYSNYIAANGCDSIYETTLIVNANYYLSDTVDICSGKTHVVNNNSYSVSGIYVDTLNSISNCDSIVITHLTVHPNSDSIVIRNICEGDSIVVGTNVYDVAGVYYDTLSTSYGCDSTIITQLNVYIGFSIYNSVNICNGSFYAVGNNIYTASGIYRDTMYAAFGCDSIIITNLTVNPTLVVTQSINICHGDFYSINGHIYTQTGIYLDTMNTQFGCDSVMITNLNVLQLDTNLLVNSNMIFSLQSNASYQWLTCDSIGYQTVSGANSQAFLPTISGWYALALQMGSCLDTIACIQFVPVGINENYLNGFVMYPNPVSDNLFIHAETKMKELNLFDVTGKLLYSIVSPAIPMSIDLSNYSAGFYFIQVKYDGHSLTKKIIIARN